MAQNIEYKDIKAGVQGLDPASAVEVAQIAQLAMKKAAAEGKNFDGSPSPSGAVFVPAKAALIAAYEAQQARDMRDGYMLTARSGLPIAADVPTITASATDPSADADAATQIIYPFGNIGNVDPIPFASLSKKQWYRGHSPGLRGRIQNGDFMRLAATCTTYAQNGSQDQDSALGYGIDKALVTLDVYLDSDVLFFRTFGGSNTRFALYVNGSLVTAAPGAGMTQSAHTYAPSAKYIKIKWSTVERRRVQMVFSDLHLPTEIRTRAVSTITSANTEPLAWIHNGDSFSQFAGASAADRGLDSWLHAAFGLQFDFVNIAQGGSSLSGGVLVGETPTSGRKPSQRLQYGLHARNLGAQVASYLLGVNDVGNGNPTESASELALTLRQVADENPGILQFVFATNTGPGINQTNANAMEVALLEAARSVPGVYAIPLQTASDGPFLRGTGRVGATNGTGNADLYTSTDALHPSDAGHRAYGQYMARQIYAALTAS